MDRSQGGGQVTAPASAGRCYGPGKAVSPALWFPGRHPQAGTARLKRLARRAISERCALAHRAVVLAGRCSDIAYIHAAADLLQARVASVAISLGWAPAARLRHRRGTVEVIGANAWWVHLPSHSAIGFGDPGDIEFVAALYLFIAGSNDVVRGALRVQGETI